MPEPKVVVVDVFDQRRIPEKIPPYAADTPCAACGDPIVADALFVPVPLGPGDNREEQEKAAEGQPFTAVAALVHVKCATGRAS